MGLAQWRGRAGEALAAAYLELVGCRIVARNARLGGVEVDLVADDGATRVLVEVRLRTRADYGGAAATVDAAKRARLARAAGALAAESHRPVRVDVLAVDVSPDGARLTHYRSALSG